MSSRVPGKGLNWQTFYDLLKAPVTEFDCGTLCAPSNGGVPLCCDGSQVIPVLYKGEFKMLMERTSLWREWQPETAADRRLKDDLPKYQLAVCKGAAFCERDNRSLNCRTFPFMPYFDHSSGLAGLVYDVEAAVGKCPLVERPEAITRRYIEESLVFWDSLVDADAHEREFYLEESERVRRYYARRRRSVPVLVPEGMRHYPTARRVFESQIGAGKLPRLKPMVRPTG